MNANIEKFILSFDEDSRLDFTKLVEFIKFNNIPIKQIGIKVAPAVTSAEVIYLDFDGVLDTEKRFGSQFIYFLILHEIGHFLRLRKYGENLIKDMYAIPEYPDFLDKVMEEENFADKFGCIMFYKLNGVRYMGQLTNRDVYAYQMSSVYNAVHHGKLNYEAMLEQITYEI